MVNNQIVSRGINDESIINAFLNVQREKFIPEQYRKESYGDYPLPIGEDQTISQPYIIALMLEMLLIEPKSRILEIGSGSGYLMALMAEMGAEVFGIERNQVLYEKSEQLLNETGYRVKIKNDDGTVGWPEYSPFNGIIVSAAAPKLPDTLIKQLAENGRLIIPIGTKSIQVLKLYIRTGQNYSESEHGGCRFVPLIGKYGWDSENG